MGECRKLVTCPLGSLNYGCTAYYQKCYATNCCKCEDVDAPKKWDIQGAPDGLFNRVQSIGSKIRAFPKSSTWSTITSCIVRNLEMLCPIASTMVQQQTSLVPSFMGTSKLRMTWMH